MSENNNEHYIPGHCNIGDEEIKRRKIAGYFGLGLTVVFILFFQLFHFSRSWRLLVFFPVSLSLIGVFQAWFKFCVAFGMKGIFNFGEFGKTFAVEQDENKRKDHAKSRQIIMLSLLASFLFTIIYYLLPL